MPIQSSWDLRHELSRFARFIYNGSLGTVAAPGKEAKLLGDGWRQATLVVCVGELLKSAVKSSCCWKLWAEILSS